MKGISFKPVWFDSLGAKSSCVLVKTHDVSILIDPGAAVMQPSYPASDEEKVDWLEEAEVAIKDASGEAEVVVISHYHYDHFTDFDEELYDGKTLFVKSPNEYINDSQRRRAERFLDNLCRAFGETTLESMLKDKEEGDYRDPWEDLTLARGRDYGDYSSRKRELLKKGRKWFLNRAQNWRGWREIPKMDFDRVKVVFCDGEEFLFGGTKLRFTKPLFHGVEYSRVGWVLGTVVECGREKLVHSSDLNGPIIEDYAEWIIEENPDILFLDGPMTYMFGYLLNRINLNRAVENASSIVREIESELIVYDHHLTREPRFKELTENVWATARREGKKLVTCAEVLGKKPKILEITEGKR
ncbi:MAG: MBL fold metallo-hydrolase [Candidatus Geothermarchaeales archaeon]